MAGGGLMVLIAYGTQNVIMSGNPQMTYYYKFFKRHSHFSMENITLAMDGPNELQYDQSIQLRAKILRHGDLLSDMFFSFQIPDIYSKYATPKPPNGRTSQFEFKWSRYLGTALIQRVAFFVGGQKIQEFDGTYLLAKAQLEYEPYQFEKWRILVGDTDEIMNPAQGAYSGGTGKTGYPSVILDQERAGTNQLNRPSIPATEVHVPLGFWFADATSQALPLVALQYQECEVQLTLNPIRTLYSILDASGYRVAPDFRMNASIVNAENNVPTYGAAPDVSGQLRYFLTDIGYSPPEKNTWFLNPRLQCTYVYLADEERQTFASRPLSYVFPQVMTLQYPGLIQSQTIDLDIHNPITRLIFVPRRSDWIYRNDFANFTNWFTYPFAPFRTPTLLTTQTFLVNNSITGRLIANSQKDIIRQLRVLCDGNEIQEIKPTDFFTKIAPYRYTSGFTNAELPIYTWAITSSKIQPSGSLNASLVRNLQLELGLWTLPPGTSYTYNLTLYVESINFFVVASGSGGAKYVL